MGTPKTVKDFATNFETLSTDLKTAGFQNINRYGLEENKTFHSISHNFLNVMSDAVSFFSVIFPNFNKSEIRQLVSFLFFMKHIFDGNKINQDGCILFNVLNDHQGFTISSVIFDLNINDGIVAIGGASFNKYYMKPLDVKFHDIMYTLKKSFKSNITFYFENVVEIDTALINTIINETVYDYFWRKNNSTILNNLSDDDFINQLIEICKENIIDSKATSLKITYDYNEIDQQQLNNEIYIDSLKSKMKSSTVFVSSFSYQDLRQMRSFFEKIITSESIDKIFQIIDLYVFKQKVHGLFIESDIIKVFRNNFNTHEKKSLSFLTGLCIQICGLSIDLNDVVKLSDDICCDSDKIVSDDLDYVEKSYKISVIKHIEKEFEIPAKDITAKSLLIYQMSII